MDNIPDSLTNKPYYVDVCDFYKSIFIITNPKKFSKVPLEDVFTFIDRSISGEEDTNRLGIERIYEMKRSFKRLIAMVLNEKLINFADSPLFRRERDIYRKFFNMLIEKRIEILKADPFSIVTLNWDTIPEYFINTLITHKKVEDGKKIQIDYTCYDYNY